MTPTPALDSVHDPLLGLCPRSVFMSRVHREVVRSWLNGAPLSLLMADIDQFDDVKRLHGPDLREGVAREVAALLSGAVRDTNACLTRLSGSDFCALLPGADIEAAARCAESIRQSVESALATRVADCPITVSIGVATSPHGRDWSATELLEMADGRLQGARNNGLNTILARDNEGIVLPPQFATWPSLSDEAALRK